MVATRTYGKGRVVAFAAVGDGFIPEAIDPVKTRTYGDYWEYQYSLLARAVLWAARGKGDLSIRKLEATAESGLTLVLASPGARTVEVEARARERERVDARRGEAAARPRGRRGSAWGSQRPTSRPRAGPAAARSWT